MWFMAVYSKAWPLLWNTGSSRSLREEDSSLRSGLPRLRQLLRGMGSISHRFTMPTDHWRTDLMPDGMVERMSPLGGRRRQSRTRRFGILNEEKPAPLIKFCPRG